MPFKQTVQTKPAPTSAAAAPRKAGGRFSGIRPKEKVGVPDLEAGEYILEIVKTRSPRGNTSTCIEGMVVLAEGKDPTPAGTVGAFYINYGDYSDEALVCLAMAICDCETAEELEVKEPFFDILLDACAQTPTAEMFCKPGETEPYFGVNPAGGVRVHLKLWAGKNMKNNGKPFLNGVFSRCPDEYKTIAIGEPPF